MEKQYMRRRNSFNGLWAMGCRSDAQCVIPGSQRLNFYSFALLVSCLFLFTSFYGCSSVEPVKRVDGAAQVKETPPEITSITASDNSLTISASAPFEYTIYKPDDPFKVVVGLKGVSLGKYTRKIVPDVAGITEVRPEYARVPTEGARLEVLLSSPANIVPQYRRGTLTLLLKEEAAGNQSSEEPSGSVSEAAVDLPPAQYIDDVSMERLGDKVVVVVNGDGRMIPDVFPLDGRLVIDIPGVDMRASVPETVIKPLRGIRWGEYEGRLRIVLDLDDNTTFDVVSIANRIEISLRSPELLEESASEISRKVDSGEARNKVNREEGLLAESAREIVAGKYTGRKISLDFQDADIIPIFRLLADVSGYNVVVDPQVKGKVTIKLINVPWDQALDLIMKTHNLGMVLEGNIIRIAPLSVLVKEREEAIKAKDAARKAEPLVTKVFPISYADVSKVKSAIDQGKILSERGNVSVDQRISSLIIKDVPSNMPKVERLIRTLDQSTPQVMIEARIVEVNTNVSQEFGVRWGFVANASNRLSNVGGLTPYVVDFPAAGAGPGSGSGITFGFLNAARTLSLNVELSALETTGQLKIVSNPRIITVDNQEAFISQGKSIPVRKLTSEGTVSTEFKDVKLELKVKPHITPDGSVILSVEAKKEELDPTIPSVEGVPGTDKKEAKTNVIIKDGETLVIGGIYKTVNNNSESGVPSLKDIPFFGWLFKNKKKEAQTNELLIFITPRIIKKSPGQ
ncbi:Type IV pilus biogenesis protein PilQ [hydrothermal vent metagenome]|uniref:Type IV pilus biogenesis protein PilQ n=1 Tax=hydrothermal vent metagenome TaxID=652676 RepID=A0A3B1CQL6_9ZZZZ